MSDAFDFKDFYRQLGDRIRRRRETLGITQMQLAGRIGAKRATIANIETGRQNVLLHQLFQIGNALDLNATDLLPVVPKVTDVVTPDLVDHQDLTPLQLMQISRAYGATVATRKKTKEEST